MVDSLRGELVKFPTQDGLELAGMLCLPKKRAKKAIIHLHGMTSSFWSGTGMLLSEPAFKNNYAFFPFNNRGLQGVSFIDRSKGKDTVLGTSFEKFEDCVKDIEAAMKFLRKRGFNKFILSGHSTGCQKAVYYQSKKNSKSVEGIMLLAPADDVNMQKAMLKSKFKKCLSKAKELLKKNKGSTIMPKECKTPLFSAKRFYHLYNEKSTEGNIFNYSKKLTHLSKVKCPILAMFGKREEFSVIPPKEMLEKIKKACRNSMSETALVPGNHGFRGGEKEMMKSVSNWISKI